MAGAACEKLGRISEPFRKLFQPLDDVFVHFRRLGIDPVVEFKRHSPHIRHGAAFGAE
jgi:hypothetical protein